MSGAEMSSAQTASPNRRRRNVPDPKIARVMPVYKCVLESDMNNYRPISILPIFSKVFERVMHNQLYNILGIPNVIHRSQYGFSKVILCCYYF